MSGNGLPTSLTVLRPIGFGSIRGPDGQDVRVLPNAAMDGDIELQPTGTGTAPLRSPTAVDGSNAALSAVSNPLSPTSTIGYAPRGVRDERQMRMAEAASSSSAARARAAAGTATKQRGAGLDDVAGIEINEEEVASDNDESSSGSSSSSDEDDGAGIGFSAAELAGRATAGPRSYEQRVGKSAPLHATALSPARPLANAAARRVTVDAEEEHKEAAAPVVLLHHAPDGADALEQMHQEFAQQFDATAAPAARSRSQTRDGTPSQTTRTVLLDENNLPTESTIAPMSRQKLQTFDELKHSQRIKARSLQVAAGAILCMGVVSAVAGGLSLETAFLTPGLGAATLVAGVLQVLFGPLTIRYALQYKQSVLRSVYVSCIVLGTLQLVLGIMTATKRRDDVRGEINANWYNGEYSEAFKEKWGSENRLIDRSMEHLRFLTIAELLSAAFLALALLLSVSISHRLQRHLTLVSLQTQSKSESNSNHARRAREVAAMKAQMAADPELRAQVQSERIPRKLKEQKKREEKLAAAKGKKYAAQAEGTTPGTRSRKIKSERAAAGVTSGTTGADEVDAAAASSPVHRVKKKHKEHKKSHKEHKKHRKSKHHSSEHEHADAAATNPLADAVGAAGTGAPILVSPSAVASVSAVGGLMASSSPSHREGAKRQGGEQVAGDHKV